MSAPPASLWPSASHMKDAHSPGQRHIQKTVGQWRAFEGLVPREGAPGPLCCTPLCNAAAAWLPDPLTLPVPGTPLMYKQRATCTAGACPCARSAPLALGSSLADSAKGLRPFGTLALAPLTSRRRNSCTLFCSLASQPAEGTGAGLLPPSCPSSVPLGPPGQVLYAEQATKHFAVLEDAPHSQMKQHCGALRACRCAASERGALEARNAALQVWSQAPTSLDKGVQQERWRGAGC